MEPTPATKPTPVATMGAIIAFLTALTASATAIFKDNPTVMLWVAVAGAVVAAASVALGQLTQGKTVPLVDTAAYVDASRALVAGPAATSAPTPNDEVAIVGAQEPA